MIMLKKCNTQKVHIVSDYACSEHLDWRHY